MALKIDLLPGYVRLRRWRKWSALLSVVLVSAVGAILYLTYYQKTLEVQIAQQNVLAWQAVANEATKVEGEATAKVASLGNLEATVKFFTDATQSGPRRAVAVDLIKRYIMPDALVSSVDIPDGKTVTIVASVADSDNYGRLLTNLRKGTVGFKPPPPVPYVWASLPVASGIPGFPLPESTPPNVTGNEPVPMTFPLNISIASALTEELVFQTPLAPGETGAAPAGQPGAPPPAATPPPAGSGP